MSFNTIVSTAILEENLKNPDWVIFDCRSSLTDHEAGLKAYQSGHIPNAHFCSLETDLSSAITKTSGRHPLPDFNELAQKLSHWGVGNQTQVVAYDDVGGAFAVRLWWLLRTMGHHKVAVLDGGIPEWIKEDKTMTTEISQTVSQSFSANIKTMAWLTTDQIKENLTTKTYTVLDARTPERYRGEAEPIDTVAGRIPGSINRAFQLNLNNEGLFLSAKELRSQLKPIIDQVPNQTANKLVHLCGSGVTACHNILASEIAGITGSKLYAGSWSEWIRDSSHPVATG